MSNQQDKIAKAYKACTDCHSELTLAQYKQLMREIEQEQQQQKISNKKNDITTNAEEK